MMRASWMVVASLAATAHAAPPQPPCKPFWTARVCADESFSSSTWTDPPIEVSQSMKRGLNFQLFTPKPNEQLDVQMTVITNAPVNTAAGLLLNAAEFLSNVDPNKLTNPDTLDFDKEVKPFTVWGHACKQKSDVAGKLVKVSGIQTFAVVALTLSDGDSATTIATVTHRNSSGGPPTTAVVCGPWHTGLLPKFGTTGGGSFAVDVTPQHGGTLTNLRVQTALGAAGGTLTATPNPPTLGGNVRISFQGATHCAEDL